MDDAANFLSLKQRDALFGIGIGFAHVADKLAASVDNRNIKMQRRNVRGWKINTAQPPGKTI
jgi:hypothetical protein